MLIQSITQKSSSWAGFDNKKLLKMLGIELDKTNEKDKEMMSDTVLRAVAASSERVLLITAYCNYDDSDGRCYNWDCEFRKDEKIVSIYNFLKKLGYEISDEERALCNGTHELFVRCGEDSNNENSEPVPLKAAS